MVETGVANLASVLAALKRAGASPEVSRDAAVVREAPLVFLPGVGAFAAGMAGLRARSCELAVADRVRADRPLMAICLGLQMLCRDSEESPGIWGMGVVDASVRRFPAGARVPHFGWNTVTPTPGAVLLREGHAYYANSYRIAELPWGWHGATTPHGGSFVAAIERGPVLGCQFHPELSGDWGQDLIGRWLEASC